MNLLRKNKMLDTFKRIINVSKMSCLYSSFPKSYQLKLLKPMN